MTTLKPLTVNHNKLQKILKKMGIPYHLTGLLKNLYVGQKATVRHETTDWFKKEYIKRKEYIKAVHCHSAYLTNMQSILSKCQAG